MFIIETSKIEKSSKFVTVHTSKGLVYFSIHHISTINNIEKMFHFNDSEESIQYCLDVTVDSHIHRLIFEDMKSATSTKIELLKIIGV